MFTVLPLLPIISLACSCFTQVFKWYFPLRFLGLGFDNKSVSLTWWLFMPFCLMNTLINVLLVTYLCSLCWIYLMTLFLNNPDRFSILCTSRKLGFLKSRIDHSDLKEYITHAIGPLLQHFEYDILREAVQDIWTMPNCTQNYINWSSKGYPSVAWKRLQKILHLNCNDLWITRATKMGFCLNGNFS